MPANVIVLARAIHPGTGLMLPNGGGAHVSKYRTRALTFFTCTQPLVEVYFSFHRPHGEKSDGVWWQSGFTGGPEGFELSPFEWHDIPPHLWHGEDTEPDCHTGRVSISGLDVCWQLNYHTGIERWYSSLLSAVRPCRWLTVNAVIKRKETWLQSKTRVHVMDNNYPSTVSHHAGSERDVIQNLLHV